MGQRAFHNFAGAAVLMAALLLAVLPCPRAFAEDVPGVVVGEPEPIAEPPAASEEAVQEEPAEEDAGDDGQAEPLQEDSGGQNTMSVPAMPEEPEAPAQDGSGGGPDAIDSAIMEVLGMEMWELLYDERLLGTLYEPGLEKKISMGNVEVELKVLQARSDKLLDVAQAPMTIARIKSNGFEVRHPLYPSRRMEFEYIAPPSKPPLLGIYERCDCAEPEGDLLHLFAIHKRLLKPLGPVSGLEDADGDGLYEPFVYEEAFKGGLGILQPDSVIRIKVFFDVSDGRLKPAGSKYSIYYLQKITELDDTISRDRAESAESGDLAPILEKFLCYRAMGKEEDGWGAFNSDVERYGGHMFPQRRAEGQPPENIRVEEIKGLMKRAFPAPASR